MRTVGFELILEALDVSLDLRKIAFAMGGLFVTGAVAGLLVFIALTVDSTALTIALLAVAGLFVWVLASLVQGTIAKMSYDDLNRRHGGGLSGALGYTARRLHILLFAPLVLTIGIVLVLVVEGLLLLIGRIPNVGELWVSLLFLPLVLLNLFVILLSYLGVWLIPAVVAGEPGGFFDTLRRVLQAVRRAPGRLIAYSSIAAILWGLAAMIIVPLVSWATAGTLALTTAAMGPDQASGFSEVLPSDILDWAPYWLEDLTFGSGFGDSSVTFQIATGIFGVALLLIPLAILAVLLMVFPVSCACATYLSVREDEPEQVVPPAVRVEPKLGICSNCGAEVAPGARFCFRCGHPRESS